MVKAIIVPQAGSDKISAQTEYDFEVCPAVGDTITMDGIKGDMVDVTVVNRAFWSHNLKRNHLTTKITLTVTHD